MGKFTGVAQVTATFDAVGVGDWLRYVVGALEVAGAVGSGVALPLAVLLLAAAIAWGRRESTARLWASMTAVTGRSETAG